MMKIHNTQSFAPVYFMPKASGRGSFQGLIDCRSPIFVALSPLRRGIARDEPPPDEPPHSNMLRILNQESQRGWWFPDLPFKFGHHAGVWNKPTLQRLYSRRQEPELRKPSSLQGTVCIRSTGQLKRSDAQNSSMRDGAVPASYPFEPPPTPWLSCPWLSLT